MKNFTTLQKFIISRIETKFHDDDLREVCDEYKTIYGTELKDDYLYVCEIRNKVF